MLYEEFQKLYETNRKELERAASYLEKQLEMGLEKLTERRVAEGLPEHLFRIRLKEVRIKGCSSLFRKINEDETLSFEKAFDPRHVHDLIGARLVCHNLRDLEELGTSIQRFPYLWGGLAYAEPRGGAKRWIKEPKERSSGYRGWHVDVYWEVGRKAPRRYFAEVQIRTLLMDAFASLMHDDGYKDGAELPADILEQFLEISELLYPIDKMADRLRKNIQEARVSSDSQIRILEAEAEAMFFMASFLSEPLGVPLYKEVEREDVYTIDPANPTFEMQIKGVCEKKERFSFPVGGDSPTENFRLVSVERADRRTGNWSAVPKDQYTLEYPRRNVARILSQRPSINHKFKIVCVWHNIFDREREYIWAPMNHVYPNGSLTYRLALRFLRKPKKLPRLFRLRDYNSLDEVRAAFQANKGEGLKAVEVEENYFRFNEPLTSDNYLCFFEQGSL